MAKTKFSLDSVISGALGDLSNLDNPEKLEYISILNIDADKRNFYAMDGIEELAANIELVGLQQPIRLRENEAMPGRYRIVSGHRRRAAIWTLYEAEPEKWEKIPCIVEHDKASEAMQELRLIYANSATRKLSDADLAKQAEKVTELLYQLKNEGVEFPGSMRKYVAEACQISETKLATLRVIRSGLSPSFASMYDDGKLSTDAAYKLAKLTTEQQTIIAEAMTSNGITGKAADNLANNAENYDKVRFCVANNCDCNNREGFYRATVRDKYGYDYCTGGCCGSCYQRGRCPGCCATVKEKMSKEKKAEQKRNERAEAERQKQYDKSAAQSVANAKRILAALGSRELNDCLKFHSYDRSVSIDEIRAVAEGEKEPPRSYCPEYCFDNDRIIAAMAKQLDCTADYLVGLTDEPKRPAGPTCEWRTGRPDAEGSYVVKIDIGTQKPLIRILKWKCKQWHFPGTGGILSDDVLGWYKIPED